ncbi:alpha-(1,3)-fucosyltransferase C-like [Maniola jurtina]|uniref:alpha-(1,3)-fucosyltransferase C-like n=1 Tax=Maniola jurtina TaxID=191418 RepID=UPI001E68DDF8|nr:alpha-(1,3)-fucosyltransferase C-like [Maniola jurtina]
MVLKSFYMTKRALSVWCYILLTLVFYTGIKLYYLANMSTNLNQESIRNHVIGNYRRNEYKFILVWPNSTKFKLLEKGDETFINNNCEYKNCFATDDLHLLSSVKEFDAVVFNALDITLLQKKELLKERSLKQKYIFAAYESAVYVPMCFQYFDGFFNLTWTYKLDSDIVATNINIYDLKGKVVGPRVDMKWVKKMLPTNEELRLKLSNKIKAAAWMVNQCITLNRREELVKKLRVQLVRFGLTVDIYGKCGTRECPGNKTIRQWICNKLIENNYYFYLAFEDSWASDYVTEELSRALNNYAVPIVYGGADYSRFVPDGAYLDARELGEVELAYKMNEIINNKTKYYDFFRWRNHYKYTINTDASKKDVCQLCALLNNKDKMSEVTVWKKFREWWNEGNFDCRYHEFFDFK